MPEGESVPNMTTKDTQIKDDPPNVMPYYHQENLEIRFFSQIVTQINKPEQFEWATDVNLIVSSLTFKQNVNQSLSILIIALTKLSNFSKEHVQLRFGAQKSSVF